MKRHVREATENTRVKMSLAHAGKKHSTATKQKISRSMTKYWQTIPSSTSQLRPTSGISNNEIDLNLYE